MNRSEEELIQSLITGGIVGGALGALFSDEENRKENATLLAIAGAAILASYKASQRAKETNLPVYKIKNGTLIKEHPDGRIEVLKERLDVKNNIPNKFKLT